MTDETATDLLRHVKLTTGERPCPSNRITRPGVVGSF
jgi:hypothetical protein